MNLSTDPRAELRKKLLRRMLWKVPLVFLLMSLAVWWQMRRENQIPVEGSQQGLAKAAEFTGAWRGEVTYHWGAKHTEHFFFQPEANKLFGTATFLGAKRGIEEGQIIVKRRLSV